MKPVAAFTCHRGLRELPERLRGSAVAVGNFDGLHRGHQVVLGQTLQVARQSGCAAVVLTFEPHPRTYFAPEKPLFRLTPATEKATLVKAYGLDGVVVIPFDSGCAGQAPGDFVQTALVDGLAARHVLVGFDFHFGKNRAGNPPMLTALGRQNGFDVRIIEAVGDTRGAVSSSRIRAALRAADVTTAARLLGYHWFFHGTVIHGEKRGRTLGYPTANLRLPPHCQLAHGIYAVRVMLAATNGADKDSGRIFDGVASFGRRPTFDNGAPLFEVFLFDFAGDLYGADVRVGLMAHIRSERKFASVEALVAQMDADTLAARRRLATIPATALDTALWPYWR